jgi:transcriptional regulator with XRE-family HTH domain
MKKKVKPATRGVQEADKIVGERIKARRNELGVSQQDLGEKLGVSFQQVQKYEKGVNRVTTGRLIQLCRALQCDLTDLADIGGIKPAKITAASTFAATREGVAIIDAMSRIEDLDVRRQIISLAERLAA